MEIGPRKHFDTSGKSGSLIHHRATGKTPVAQLGNGLLGAIAGKKFLKQLKLYGLARRMIAGALPNRVLAIGVLREMST